MNKKLLLLLGLNFILTCLAYMVFPFLSIYLITTGVFSVSDVGIIIGFLSLASFLSALFIGNIIKVISPKYALVIGIITLSIFQILFLYVQSLIIALALALVLGMGKAMVSPSLKIIFSINKDDTSSQVVFRLRYISLCVAIIIGPILGSFLFNVSITFLFYLTSLLLLVVALLFIPISFKYFKVNGIEEVVKTPNADHLVKHSGFTNNAFSFLDFRLSFIIFLGVLVFSVFSVFESVLPLSLTLLVYNPQEIFALLLVLNSIIALIIQPLIIKVSSKFSAVTLGAVGCLFFSVSYITFGFSVYSFKILILALFLFTIGEALAVPTLDILVDTISPKNKKATYFALAELKQLGFFISPIVGGFIIENFTVTTMFFISSIVSFLCFILYLVLAPTLKLKEKENC